MTSFAGLAWIGPATAGTVAVAVAGIEIVRSGPAGADEGDHVAYQFIVTNTGNTMLSDVTVRDDTVGAIGAIASLAPGSTRSFERVSTVPVQSAHAANVAKACGRYATTEGWRSICDEARHTTELLQPAVTIVPGEVLAATAEQPRTGSDLRVPSAVAGLLLLGLVSLVVGARPWRRSEVVTAVPPGFQRRDAGGRMKSGATVPSMTD